MALSSIVVFISKVFLPSPIDKFMIILQVIFYTLANFMVGRFGGTMTGIVSGLLTQFWRPAFFPFTFLFALIYGLMIDCFISLFRVKTSSAPVNTWRLMIALSIASAILGGASMYVTVMVGMMPWAPSLYLMILIGGVLNGFAGGYITAQVWNKYLLKKWR
ncbi:MAG: hypothetical protein QXF28_04730 [Nitrososphaerota archaeon]